MKILLIRHGESVDNVAGIAGSRDSPLTAHGILQAKCLGTHLSARSDSLKPITHVFASDLSRAYKTAEAIVEACSLGPPMEFVRVVELREKCFGALEGAKYATPLHTVKGVPPETLGAIQARVNRFLDQHLVPVVRARPVTNPSTVLIVAHGMVLNVLFQTLASRFHPENVVCSLGDFHVGTRQLPWRNTGYLESILEVADDKVNDTATADHHLRDLKLVIEVINCVEHLKGLKKTGGGIGSSKFDPKQGTLDAFLSKQ